MCTLIISVLWIWCLGGSQGAATIGSATIGSASEAVIDDFTVERNWRVVLQDRFQNNVTLSCRNGSTVLGRQSADFWVVRGADNSVPEDLQSIIGISIGYPHPSKAQINFTMCPDIEGNFFCGDISAMTRSANNLTLVAAPTLRKAYVDCYSASVGEVVTLACPFRRGRLLQYYSFSWLQGFSTVFNSADVNSASAGFIANLSDFSLTIPSVTLSHKDVYRCLLVVSNPLGANAFSGPESDDIDLFVLEGENSTSYEQSVCSRFSYVSPTSLSADTTPTLYVSPTSLSADTTPTSYVSPTSLSANATPTSYVSPTSLSANATPTLYVSPTSLSADATPTSYVSPTSLSANATPTSYVSPTSLSANATPTLYVSPTSLSADTTPTSYVFPTSLSANAIPTLYVSLAFSSANTTPTTTLIETTGTTEAESTPHGPGPYGRLIYITIAVLLASGLAVAVAGGTMYRWRTKRASRYNEAERGSGSVDRPTSEMNTDEQIPDPVTNNISLCVQVPHNDPTTSGLSPSLSIAENLSNVAPDLETSSIQSVPNNIQSETIISSPDADPIPQQSSSLPGLNEDNRSLCEHANDPGIATSLISSAEVSHTASRNDNRSVPTILTFSTANRGCLLSSTTTPGNAQILSPLSPASLTHSRSCPSQSAETVSWLQQIDDFHDNSIEFVFIGFTRVVVCDSRGGKYEVPDHGITIQIPPDAVEGTVEFEVGIAAHGSFRFPPNLRPISAIVWLAVHDRSDDKSATFVFKKPVDIHMPHFLNLTNSDIDDKTDELGLGFIRTAEEMDRRQRLIFTEGPREEVSYQQRHAKIRTNHFCFVCLSAKKSAIPERSRYLLTRVLPDPVRVLQWDMNFCVSFDLESFVEVNDAKHEGGKTVQQSSNKHTQVVNIANDLSVFIRRQLDGFTTLAFSIVHGSYGPGFGSREQLFGHWINSTIIQMIKEQYPQQGMKFTTISFQFVPMAGDEKLKIMLDHKFDTAGWRIAFQSSQQVMMSAVHDIWENDVSDLQARVKFKAYPPRITAAVSGDAAFDNVTETVSFEGARGGDLSRGVNLMLPTDHVDKNQERLNFLRTQSQPVPESHSQIAIARANSAPQNVIVAVPDEPTTQERVEVMKVILAKYRSWHILFQTLGIPDDCREEILQEQISVKTKILKMLNTWVELNRHNGHCTRFNLATILEQTDSSLRPAVRLLRSPREYMQIENR